MRVRSRVCMISTLEPASRLRRSAATHGYSITRTVSITYLEEISSRINPDSEVKKSKGKVQKS